MGHGKPVIVNKKAAPPRVSLFINTLCYPNNSVNQSINSVNQLSHVLIIAKVSDSGNTPTGRDNRSYYYVDRIAQELPSTAGRKKIEGRCSIGIITGLTPDALNWLEQLAAVGKAGETIGLLANEYFKNKGEQS